MAETLHPVCAAHVSSRGPRFFRADAGVMFEFTLDARSKVGPRPMIAADKHQYPGAWRAFEEGEQAEPVKAGVEFVDHPEAKAAHDQEKAERQRKMDAKRGGGL
jgi:hypothetical protein